MAHESRSSFNIPELDDLVTSEGDPLFAFGFVDDENDHIITSRLGHLVDRSEAMGHIMGMRAIDDPADALDDFDSKKDDYGNSGISPLDVLFNGERW